MNTSRKNARWAGVFYIMATAAPILTIVFIGFLGGGVAGEPVPDYLDQVSAGESNVILGMFVEVTWALVVVGIVVTLYPILKKHNEALALGFSGLRFMEAISTMIHSIILLSLLTLGRQVAAAGSPDASTLQLAGTLHLAAREWTFMIGSGLVWSLSALLLNVLLLQKTLVPRWLSIWGLVGATVVLVNTLFDMLAITIPNLGYLMLLNELFLGVWLIVKGFNQPARVETPA